MFPRFLIEKVVMYVVLQLEQEVTGEPSKDIKEAIAEEPEEEVQEDAEENPKDETLDEPQEEQHEPFEQLLRAQ